MVYHLNASLLLLLCRLCLLLQLCYGSTIPLTAPLEYGKHKSSIFSFNTTWQVLGPFQIGTRGMQMLSILLMRLVTGVRNTSCKIHYCKTVVNGTDILDRSYMGC
jgi:hypothetical protein